MGGTSRGLSRRSFVGAGALGIGALALRPRRTLADLLDPRSPAGLWGVARTQDGLVGLWASGGRPVAVQLSEQGPVVVERVLGVAPPGVAVAVAAGEAPALLGATEEAVPGVVGIATDHLPASVRAALEAEVDGPLAVAGLAPEHVRPRHPVARTLAGAPTSLAIPPVAGGIAASVLHTGGPVWAAVQHPPDAEGDHCSSLTVFHDGRPALEVADLGASGPATLAGAASSPVVGVVDGTGRLRAWVLGGAPHELASPGPADLVAVHVADGRPVALLSSAAGATLLGHGARGWEVKRDVEGTAACRRVLAVAGEAAEFLVEVDGGVRLVDGEGRVR